MHPKTRSTRKPRCDPVFKKRRSAIGNLLLNKKTLSAIASSYADNLITRAADVTLKEGRNLILAVRETPLHAGHLDKRLQAARVGAIIYPPVPAFYARPKSVEDIIDNLVGRILMR